MMMRESYMRSRVMNKMRMALLRCCRCSSAMSSAPWSIMHLKMTCLATSRHLVASALVVLREASFNTFEHLVLIPKP
jgi:hypothetical protein